MVGVAGKSRSCDKCRKRRVKCDFVRPFCGRCVKANLTCGGYEREILFLNRTPMSLGCSTVSLLSESRKEKDRSEATLSPELGDSAQSLIERLSGPSYSHRDFRVQALRLLKRIYLPRQQTRVLKLNQTIYSWVYCLSDLAGPSQALDFSLLLFCVSQLRASGTDTGFVEQRLQLYNLALQNLRADIQHSEKRTCEETLAAILFLTTSELYICPAEHGWRAHAHGLSEILQLQDPFKCRSPMWRHLFFRLQIVCLLNSLTKRHASFLADTEWLRIANMSLHRDQFSDLYDIIIHVPAVLERLDNLNAKVGVERIFASGTALFMDCASLSAKMSEWYNQFLSTFSKSPYWAVPSSLSNPVDATTASKTFPFSLDFLCFDTAIMHITFWSVLVQLHSNMICVYNLLQDGSDSPLNLEELLTHHKNEYQGLASVHTTDPPKPSLPSISSIIDEADKSVRYLCQSMEYCYKMEMGTCGPQTMTWPKWVIRQYFRQHPGHERELAWCEQLTDMRASGSRFGLEMMRFSDSELALVRSQHSENDKRLLG